MRKKLIILATVSTALAMPSMGVVAATSTNDGKNDCVAFSTLLDSKNYPGYVWQVLDNYNFVLLVNRTQQLYRVRVSLPLPALSVARQLEFQQNGPWLCDMPPSTVVLVGREPPNTASISEMKQLGAADIAALEKQYNTKIAPKKKT